MCITHLQTLESFQLHCTISYFQDVRSEFRFFAKDITLIKKNTLHRDYIWYCLLLQTSQIVKND